MNSTCEGVPPVGLVRHVGIGLLFIVGVAGNAAALWILCRAAKTRNPKHSLMLRCLAVNDLIAEVGMFTIITLQRFRLVRVHAICAGFVLLRGFGIGSGCVAFVMALERWMALTRPFYYQQLVTYRMIKIFLFGLWSMGAFLAYLPLFGFGLYYDSQNNSCCRYRDAVELDDQIYAYIFFVFGTALCLCIACCNLTVIWELFKIRSHDRVLVRRVSRSTIQSNMRTVRRYQTPEEIAFAKMMAIICIIFVSCWAPQMISIPLAPFWKNSASDKVFSRLANILMCIYFTVDPYVYVLYRYVEKKKITFSCCCCCYPTRSSNSLASSSGTAGTPTSVLLHPPSYSTSLIFLACILRPRKKDTENVQEMRLNVMQERISNADDQLI